MRIGFDITALYVAQGGIFYYDYNLLKALLAYDQENHYCLLDYYSIHGGYTDPPELHDLGSGRAQITMQRLHGLRHRKLSRLSLFQRPRLYPLAKWVDEGLLHPWAILTDAVMRRKVSQAFQDVDVFHSSEVLLWRHPSALNVTTIYDLTPLLFPEYHTQETLDLQWKKYRFAQEQADVIIAISESTKRDLVTHLGIAPERIQVVYAGVNPVFHPIDDREVLRRALEPFGLEPEAYILHVGTLEPRKNLVRLVEAYARVRAQLSVFVPPLVLAGAPGWNFQEIFVCVKDLGLEEYVHFLGRVSGELLPHLYSGASLFVYPSVYEGFGMPPLEAMACGTPVITSNTSSLPEVVGAAGKQVDTLDISALAQEMLALLVDAEQRNSLRAAGLARVAEFSWARAAKRVLSIYEGSLRF